MELIALDIREPGPLVRALVDGITSLTALVHNREQRLPDLENQGTGCFPGQPDDAGHLEKQSLMGVVLAISAERDRL